MLFVRCIIQNPPKFPDTHEITEPTYQTELFYAIAFEAGRQAEREKCAQILERQDVDPSFKHRMASAIRARGEVK